LTINNSSSTCLWAGCGASPGLIVVAWHSKRSRVAVGESKMSLRSPVFVGVILRAFQSNTDDCINGRPFGRVAAASTVVTATDREATRTSRRVIIDSFPSGARREVKKIGRRMIQLNVANAKGSAY